MKRASPPWILGAGWLVFLLYAYPGYLPSDAANQLVDSRVGDFTDWRSPIMTEVWRLLGRVISGPAGMLLLQSALLLFGTYHLARRTISDRAAAVAASSVLVLPPAMATTAMITPDALLAGLLLSGAAALASERRGIRLGGLGLVALACGMNDGAPVAALPVALAMFVWHADHSRWRRLAIAAGAWLVAVLLAWGTTWLLIDLRTERDQTHLAMRDIAGTLEHADDISDTELQSVLQGTPLTTTTGIQQRARGGALFAEPESDAEREALYAARRALMRAEPGAYLAHRGRVFLRALGIIKMQAPVYTEFVAYREHSVGLQHAARHSLVQRALIAPVEALGQTPLMRPYLYFALALLLLPFAALRRQRTATVLLVSALAYELSLFVSTIRAEYRESHWLIVATLLASALLASHALEARNERVGE